jgi:hypothetical protein
MLQKSTIDVSFAQGLDQKSDPFRVQPGKFLSLVNSVFTKGGLLQKRNGFGQLTTLPNTSNTYLTTFNNDLTAIDTSFNAYSSSTESWVNRGNFQPLDLSTLPLIRSSTNQSQVDTAVANGLVLTTYADYNGTNTIYKFAVADLATGQILIAPTAIVSSTGSVSGPPRAFALGNYLVVVYGTSTAYLRYFGISTNSLLISPTADAALTYASTAYGAFDGVVIGSRLYLAWNTGSSVEARYITQYLSLSNEVIPLPPHAAAQVSVAADAASGNIWVSYLDSSLMNAYTTVLSPSLLTILTPTATVSSVSMANLTSVVSSSVATLFYETNNNYTYTSDDSGTPGNAPTHYISSVTVSQAGTVGTAAVVARSVGIASKPFVVPNNPHTFMLSAFQSTYQPSYFVINEVGQVVAKLANSNGGGYITTGVPQVTVIGSTAYVPYQLKDVVEAVNKSQISASVLTNAGVYSQTGLNLAQIDFTSATTTSSEIAGSLHLSGGLLWQYDGYTPVEHGFNLWPDCLGFTTTTGGNMAAQIYNYQATYEWADNQGNVHRSAPSVPLVVDLSASGTDTNTVTVDVPTLRLTYKIASPLKIVLYRWSTAQQTFYQVTSITQPILNNPAVDSISFTDTQADSDIIGNNVLYTLGGVVENIGAPATKVSTLFKTRLVLVDAENPNLLWYSKQVIESVPVETSDLFTIYVPPVASGGVATGGTKAISVMDDKLIVFKDQAVAYITGEGPDNTGANNDFSDAVYITSTVGCANQRSIVFMPQGLMFQASHGQGIWLLGRDLSTQYVGAPVENNNTSNVLSAINVPGTTQVRFTMDNGTTLMYDYYYQQWGSFQGIAGLSSTVFQSEHTFINEFGQVFQETPGVYLDGSAPVLLSFTTGWFDLAGLQGYQRFYFLYLLGRWLTPFKLNVGISYDFNSSIVQSTLVQPSQVPSVWGGDPVWGASSPWGTPPGIFSARVFPQKQKCESFQLTINELFDPSFGTVAGAGLTLSGINLVIGAKKGYRTNSAAENFG